MVLLQTSANGRLLDNPFFIIESGLRRDLRHAHTTEQPSQRTLFIPESQYVGWHFRTSVIIFCSESKMNHPPLIKNVWVAQ